MVRAVVLRNGDTGKANPVSVALQVPCFRKKPRRSRR
jgi:hypothetical protein